MNPYLLVGALVLGGLALLGDKKKKLENDDETKPGEIDAQTAEPIETDSSSRLEGVPDIGTVDLPDENETENKELTEGE